MPLRDDVVVADYDFADYIVTAEDARTTIATAFEDGDPAIINRAIGAVARARGMTALAAEAGVTRDALYKGLAPDGNPSLRTVLKVLGALGLGLRPVMLSAAAAATDPATHDTPSATSPLPPRGSASKAANPPKSPRKATAGRSSIEPATKTPRRSPTR